MNTKQIITAICITGFLILSACGTKSQKGLESTEGVLSEHSYYTCTMHPEVHLDNPAKCPICGMELIKKEAIATDSVEMHQRSDSMPMN